HIFVKDISPESLAARDGNIQEGDVVLKINGTVTENLSLIDAKKLIERSKGKLKMVVQRDERATLLNIPDLDDSIPSANASDRDGEGHYIAVHRSREEERISKPTAVPGKLAEELPALPKPLEQPVTREEKPLPPLPGGECGARLAGGNDVGIFVAGVLEDSPAAKEGLEEGDQLLRVKRSPPAQRKEVYRRIVESDVGDSFYIRTHFEYEKESPYGLSFNKGEVFRVVDTLYNGKLGSWLAIRIGKNHQEVERGIIPNKNRAEQLSSVQYTLPKTAGGDRADFWRFRGLRSSKRNLRKSREDLSAQPVQSKFPAYERVVLREAGFLRPVVIFGPIADVAREKISREEPDLFELAKSEPRDAGKDQRSSGIIRLHTIKQIIDKDKHAVLDITPNAVDRLNYAQWYPIVVFLNPDNKQGVKNMRTRLCSESRKSARKLYERALKLRKEQPPPLHHHHQHEQHERRLVRSSEGDRPAAAEPVGLGADGAPDDDLDIHDDRLSYLSAPGKPAITRSSEPVIQDPSSGGYPGYQHIAVTLPDPVNRIEPSGFKMAAAPQQQDSAALAIPSSLLPAAVVPPVVEAESQHPALQVEGMTPEPEEAAPAAAPQAADSLPSSHAPTELAPPPTPPSLEPQPLSDPQLGPGPKPKVLTYLLPPPQHLPAASLEHLDQAWASHILNCPARFSAPPPPACCSMYKKDLYSLEEPVRVNHGGMKSSLSYIHQPYQDKQPYRQYDHPPSAYCSDGGGGGYAKPKQPHQGNFDSHAPHLHYNNRVPQHYDDGQWPPYDQQTSSPQPPGYQTGPGHQQGYTPRGTTPYEDGPVRDYSPPQPCYDEAPAGMQGYDGRPRHGKPPGRYDEPPPPPLAGPYDARSPYEPEPPHCYPLSSPRSPDPPKQYYGDSAPGLRSPYNPGPPSRGSGGGYNHEPLMNSDPPPPPPKPEPLASPGEMGANAGSKPLPPPPWREEERDEPAMKPQSVLNRVKMFENKRSLSVDRAKEAGDSTVMRKPPGSKPLDDVVRSSNHYDPDEDEEYYRKQLSYFDRRSFDSKAMNPSPGINRFPPQTQLAYPYNRYTTLPRTPTTGTLHYPEPLQQVHYTTQNPYNRYTTLPRTPTTGTLHYPEPLQQVHYTTQYPYNMYTTLPRTPTTGTLHYPEPLQQVHYTTQNPYNMYTTLPRTPTTGTLHYPEPLQQVHYTTQNPYNRYTTLPRTPTTGTLHYPEPLQQVHYTTQNPYNSPVSQYGPPGPAVPPNSLPKLITNEVTSHPDQLLSSSPKPDLSGLRPPVLQDPPSQPYLAQRSPVGVNGTDAPPKTPGTTPTPQSYNRYVPKPYTSSARPFERKFESPKFNHNLLPNDSGKTDLLISSSIPKPSVVNNNNSSTKPPLSPQPLDHDSGLDTFTRTMDNRGPKYQQHNN
ncbi:unnamed protein product, partial [Coregonus sp. 'balchen']